MKYFLFCFVLCMFHTATFATTVNYDWFVDGTGYAQTTCETGDDLILPTPSPTKYGYHFVGWIKGEIFGSWSQSGTPSPQNPIEPVFTQLDNTVLRAVGSGDNFIVDSYDPETRTIIRRIGVKVFDGTEDWVYRYTQSGYVTFMLANPFVYNLIITPHNVCSHFEDKGPVNGIDSATSMGVGIALLKSPDYLTGRNLYMNIPTTIASDVTTVKQWLADQYNAGTPVTVYYPLATPQQESL